MRIGSLFSGYGGLDMGVQAVLGGEGVWHSDIDKGSCKLLAHRFPDVPNLGDITKIDWTAVTPVEVITAGFPCQPVSHAGKRLGDDDERWLWDEVVRAVRAIRPGLLFLENVRGLLTARGGRLFGRVLGSLADIGYDAEWACVRAADVDAAHKRERVFIAAHPNSEGRGSIGWLNAFGRDPDGRDRADGHGTPGQPATLLPTPRTSDTNGAGHHGTGGPDLRTVVSLLPTPAVNDMGAGKTVEQWDAWTARMKAAHGNGNGHGPSLSVEARRLLPTPRATDGTKGRPNQRGSSGDLMLPSAVQPQRWGKYAAAVARWESVTRPAPDPTEVGPKGNVRLSARFDEWHMGLPAGWITDVPGITWQEAVKLCGNGVVPQQAEAALRVLLAREAVAA